MMNKIEWARAARVAVAAMPLPEVAIEGDYKDWAKARSKQVREWLAEQADALDARRGKSAAEMLSAGQARAARNACPRGGDTPRAFWAWWGAAQ